MRHVVIRIVCIIFSFIIFGAANSNYDYIDGMYEPTRDYQPDIVKPIVPENMIYNSEYNYYCD